MSTLICTIELNKQENQGITIKVDGKGNNVVKHAIQLTKDSITMTSNKGENATVITQKADSINLDVLDVDKKASVIHMNKDEITIGCKEFSLKASGTITIKGKMVYLG
ncbi:MAG: hypothetical protein ABW168_28655 [Sedimenticola sp.]